MGILGHAVGALDGVGAGGEVPGGEDDEDEGEGADVDAGAGAS